MANEMDQFYQNLQTLPRLVSDLALSVAEAQRRMDQSYIENLAAVTNIIQPLLKDNSSSEYLALFQSIAPSRYQFTETVVEVRADLQMASATDLQVAGSVGLKTTLLAVAVNASYAKRSAYDYQAAALIRTVLQAIPASEEVMTKLLSAADGKQAALPATERYKDIGEAFKTLLPAKNNS